MRASLRELFIIINKGYKILRTLATMEWFMPYIWNLDEDDAFLQRLC